MSDKIEGKSDSAQVLHFETKEEAATPHVDHKKEIANLREAVLGGKLGTSLCHLHRLTCRDCAEQEGIVHLAGEQIEKWTAGIYSLTERIEQEIGAEEQWDGRLGWKDEPRTPTAAAIAGIRGLLFAIRHKADADVQGETREWRPDLWDEDEEEAPEDPRPVPPADRSAG